MIDFVLRGNHLERYAAHLSQVDREQARMLLTNQRDQLRQFLRNSLHAAYGLNHLAEETLDPTQTVEEHFYRLDPALSLRPPVAANFKDAFEKLLEQALDYEFPAHPRFDAEPRSIAVKRLAEVLARAAQQPAGRAELEPALRDDARRIAPKLELAEVGEAALQLRDDWSQHFAIGALPAECEAREQPLPEAADWDKATALAAELLDPQLAGLYRSAPGLLQFAQAARKRVKELGPPLAAYLRVIEQLLESTAATALLPGQPALREATVTRLRDWLTALETTAAEFDLVALTARLDCEVG